MYKPVLNDNFTPTNVEVDENGNFRYIDTKEPLKVHTGKKGRRYICCKLNGKSSNQSAANMVMRAWDPILPFNIMEVDHINSDPNDDRVENLEWVTHPENMRRAAENKLMKRGEEYHNSKYKDELIHQLCRLKSEGKSRQEIIKTLNINYQLHDDVCSGRSHVDISEQYLDKGFKYNEYDPESKRKIAIQICEMLEQGYSSTHITKILNLPNTCYVSDIKARRKCKDISKNYTF